jgi:hypothetical protein
MKYLKWYGIGLLVLVGVSFAVLGIKAVLFPVNVAHTAVNSAGVVVEKTLNADNVLNNYEWFFDTNASITSRQGQIAGHVMLVKEEVDAKERSRLNMELAAMRQSCRDMVTKYNANSEKANKSLFKSRGLPEVLNINVCEE